MAEWRGPEAGLSALKEIHKTYPADTLRSYQPIWIVRAHLLETLNRPAEATAALDHGIGLTDEPEVRRFLPAKRARM